MKFIFGAIALALTRASHSILDYGNVTQGLNPTEDQEKENTAAFLRAIYAANASDTDRVMEVPKGVKFSMFPIRAENMEDVTFDINGAVLATKRWLSWPIQGNYYDILFQIDNSKNLVFKSSTKSGSLDGQGFMWWVREIL